MPRSSSAYLPARCTITSIEEVSKSFVSMGFHAPGFPVAPHGLDQRIKLLIPHTDDHRDLGVFHGNLDSWYDTWRGLPTHQQAPIRTYTISEPNPETGEFRVIFARHSPPGVVGTWLTSAAVGEDVIVVLPNGESENSTVGIAWHPGNAKTVLLVGDETALPAIWNIDQSLDGVAGRAIIEVPQESDTRAFSFSNLDVTWCIRGSREYGECLVERFAELVKSPLHATMHHGEEDELMWFAPENAQTENYYWVAAESSLVRHLRRELVSASIPKTDIAFMGYWRAGKSET